VNAIRLTTEDVVALHDEALAEFGGVSGTRDIGLLESAPAKPRSAAAYGGEPSRFDLAAACCVGIAKNHPFVDGNKRTAFLATAAFLDLNGYVIDPSEADVVDTMIRVAEGVLDKNAISKWLKRHARRRQR